MQSKLLEPLVEQSYCHQENYIDNRTWGDGYIGQAKGIAEELFGEVEVGSIDEDTKLGADLITLDKKIRIGFRARRASWDGFFRKDFTIRRYHPKSNRCEYDKLIEDGTPDWLIYGFCDEARGLYLWRVINCAVLRPLLKRGIIVPKFFNGRDGTAFVAVPLLLHKYPYLSLVTSDALKEKP